jgi:hypothetical protein
MFGQIFFSVKTNPKKASGDMVPGFIVLMATSTMPLHLPNQTSPKLPSPSFCLS